MLARELRNKEDVLGLRRLTELTSQRDSAVISSFWAAKMKCVNKEGPQRPKLLVASRTAIQPEERVLWQAEQDFLWSPVNNTWPCEYSVNNTWPWNWLCFSREGTWDTHYSLQKEQEAWDFPSGAVVKNSPANAGDTGSSPGPGRSHMPQSN